MRRDMNRIIFDGPPRRKYTQSQRPREANEGLASLPKHESIQYGLGWYGTYASMNMNPFRKWLLKQVGRPWNEVYGDIRRMTKKMSSFNANMFLNSMTFCVETNTFIGEDGFVYENPVYGSPAKRIDIVYYRHRNNDLYVDPCDGLLKKSKFVQRRRKRYWDNKEKVQLNDLHTLEKIDGIWYEFIFEHLSEEKHHAFCLLEKCVVYYSDIDRSRWWSKNIQQKYAVSKRQLSKKELKKYGLVNR